MSRRMLCNKFCTQNARAAQCKMDLLRHKTGRNAKSQAKIPSDENEISKRGRVREDQKQRRENDL